MGEIKRELFRSGEVRVLVVCSPEVGEHPWVPLHLENALTSMGTSPYLNNSLLIFSILSHFVEKKYFHGNLGTYKIGNVPHNIHT
jgi:hypothetical protein